MKARIYSDYYVKVELPKWMLQCYNHEQTLTELYKLKAEIRRHVDVDSASTEFTTRNICSFCGAIWKKEWDEEMPSCCFAAQEEYNQSKAKLINGE